MRGLLLVFTLGTRRSSTRPIAGSARTSSSTSSPRRSCRASAYGALRALGAEHGAALAGATAGTVVVGVGKELRDRATHGDVSVRDLVWDAAGAASATVLLVRTAR